MTGAVAGPQTSGRRARCPPRGICHKASPQDSTLNGKWGTGLLQSCSTFSHPQGPLVHGCKEISLHCPLPRPAQPSKKHPFLLELGAPSGAPCLRLLVLSSFRRWYSFSHSKKNLGSRNCLSLNTSPYPSFSSQRTCFSAPAPPNKGFVQPFPLC